MVTVFIALSKYLITFFLLAYTFECFYVFRYSTEERRKPVYFRQNIWMFLLQGVSYLALILTEKNMGIVVFYVLQLLIFIALLTMYHVLYPHANRLILNNMCMLLSIGFVILTRLSHEKVLKQFTIAAFTLALCMFLPYFFRRCKVFDRMAWIFSACGIASLGIVLLFSRVVNGSKLNVSVFGITFQPSEFVKITFAFAIAGLLYQSTELKQLMISAAIAAIHVLILVFSKDLGSAVLYFMVYFAMVYVASGKWLYYLAGFGLGALSSVVGYFMFSHVRTRVIAWKDPVATIDTAGYQVAQSLFALGTGGWFGMGLSKGAPKTIPVVETDFIFAAICEECGVIAGMCIILICVSCVVMFLNIAMRFQNRFYKILAVGLSVTYGFQVILTLGGVTKFIPLTGVTLPLISYGGSSIMVSLILFSLIQGMYITVRDEMHAKPKGEQKEDANRETLVITYVFVAIFIAMIAYMFYYMFFVSQTMINNPYNKRQDLFAREVVRGDILSRNGEVLATTHVDEEGFEMRTYPYQNLFAHAVGFSTHGKMGVESIANFQLLQSDVYIGERLRNDFSGKKNPGNKVVTTLDIYMQQVADVSFGSYKGALIATDVRTGEILALISKPDFDANEVMFNWDLLNEDQERSVLLNRATQGLYAPGSTFKIVTALEFMKEQAHTDDYSFDCPGSFSYQGNVINCYHGRKHGEVDFTTSFAKSCNSSFANISTMLNLRSFRTNCSKLLFDEKIPCPYTYKQSTVPIKSTSSVGEVMQTAIGQGKTQITPYHMNLITQAIANDGVLMKPYVISGIYTAYNDPVSETEPEKYARLLDEKYAKQMQTLMEAVVQSGTGSKLKDTYGYTAAGKTGSAEYSTDKKKSHAWFTGYAGIDEPEICVTVIVEDGGSGGEVAVPIAKNVFDAYFGQKTH